MLKSNDWADNCNFKHLCVNSKSVKINFKVERFFFTFNSSQSIQAWYTWHFIYKCFIQCFSRIALRTQIFLTLFVLNKTRSIRKQIPISGTNVRKLPRCIFTHYFVLSRAQKNDLIIISFKKINGFKSKIVLVNDQKKTSHVYLEM